MSWWRRRVDLESPSLSLTQIQPKWPKPRDKSNEPPDEDPEYEPTPPPTPPSLEKDTGLEEEELSEEEPDEDDLDRKKEEEARKKAAADEARRKAEELPDKIILLPLSFMSCSDSEESLAPPPKNRKYHVIEQLEEVKVKKTILLTQDAKNRAKQRQMLKEIHNPIEQGNVIKIIVPIESKQKPDCSKNLKSEATP